MQVVCSSRRSSHRDKDDDAQILEALSQRLQQRKKTRQRKNLHSKEHNGEVLVDQVAGMLRRNPLQGQDNHSVVKEEELNVVTTNQCTHEARRNETTRRSATLVDLKILEKVVAQTSSYQWAHTKWRWVHNKKKATGITFKISHQDMAWKQLLLHSES